MGTCSVFDAGEHEVLISLCIGFVSARETRSRWIFDSNAISSFLRSKVSEVEKGFRRWSIGDVLKSTPKSSEYYYRERLFRTFWSSLKAKLTQPEYITGLYHISTHLGHSCMAILVLLRKRAGRVWTVKSCGRKGDQGAHKEESHLKAFISGPDSFCFGLEPFFRFRSS